MTSKVDGLDKIKFGLSDSNVLVFDTNNNEVNVLAFDGKGKQVYNLKNYLLENKVKDLSNGESNISSKTLDASSFTFADGYFEFNSISNDCSKNETSKGSHYKVVYKGNKFESPEFMNLVNCK